MATLSEVLRPISTEERAQQIAQLLQQIDSLMCSFRPKNAKTVKDQDIYVFATYKDYVVASTSPTKPEFISKVSPNIKASVNRELVGYGPLLVIRYKETKQQGKTTKDLYELQQDLQSSYQQEYNDEYYILKELGAFDIRKKWKQQEKAMQEKQPSKTKESQEKQQQATPSNPSFIDLSNIDQLSTLWNRLQQIWQLQQQIQHFQSYSKSKQPRPINDGKDYYVFAPYKNNILVSTSLSNPQFFVAKVSPNIKASIQQNLVGYGPLLTIRFVGYKQCPKTTKEIYDIQQDFQSSYQQDYQTITQHKQEVQAIKDYKVEVLRQQLGEVPNETIGTESQIDNGPSIVEGLQEFLESKRKKEEANRKRRETIQRKKEKQQCKPPDTNANATLDTNTNDTLDTAANATPDTTTNDTLNTATNTSHKPAQSNIVELDIRWDKDSPYITTPINAFSNTNASTDTQLSNITKALHKCDTALVDYVRDAPSGFVLEPLNERFCDNIVLCYYIPEQELKHCPNLMAYIDKQKKKRDKFSIRNDGNSKALQDLSDFLKEAKPKIVRILKQLDIQIYPSDIKPTEAEWEEETLRQLVKVSLADAPLEQVLRLVCDRDTKYILQEEGLYIHDIDITQDFAGCFNKSQLMRYLVEEDGRFQIQGSSKGTEYTILTNDESVGCSCLTFLHNDPITGLAIRYKYYNKFVQSLESAGVRESVGNHIVDWVYNPEQILRQSIAKSLDTGLLRLEITFYLDDDITEQEYFHQHMDWLRDLIPQHLIYHQPISKQWELYCSSITSNLCVIDLDNNKALFSYAINSLTGKINGFYTSVSKSNTLSNNVSNLLKLYTFHVPIYVVLYRKIGEQLAFQYNTYVRQLQPNKKLFQLPTYLASSKKGFSRADKNVKDNGKIVGSKPEPEQMGLVHLPHIHLTFSPKQGISKKTNTVPIVFDTIEWQPLNFPQESKRKRNNRKAEEDAQQALIQLHKQQLQTIRDSNQVSTETLEQAQQLRQRLEQEKQDTTTKLTNIQNISSNRTKLLKLLNKPQGNVLSLTCLDIGTKLYIYGIRYTNSRYGETLILAANTEPNQSSLRPYWSNTAAKEVIDENKDIWGFAEPNIILSISNKPLALLEIRDFYYNKSNHRCARVLCLPVIRTATNTIDEESINTKAQEVEQQLQQLEQQHEQALQQSPLLLRDKKLSAKESIDDYIHEGDTVSITACYPYRKSYIVQCSINNGETRTLKSNRFLSDILDEATNKFSVMVGVRKLHPTARKTMYSFLGKDNE